MQSGPMFGAANVRREMSFERFSSQNNDNFVVMRQQHLQEYRYSGNYESGRSLQHSYDAGARVNEVYGIENPPNESPQIASIQMDGYVEESRGLPPPYYNHGNIYSDGYHNFQNRAYQPDTGYENGGQIHNVEPPDQSMASHIRSGDKPSTQTERRNVCLYTAKRVVAAILIILKCVSDWLEYYSLQNPIKDVKETFQIHIKLNQDCSNKAAKDDIIAKYMYFTIFGTVFAVVQLVNIIVQIVRNHKQKYGDDPKTYLHGKTEAFISTMFVDIPQYALLIGYEDICLELKCGLDLNKKNIKILINVIVSFMKNKWREGTSSEKKKRDCSECCIRCCCPCCCCLYSWEVKVPCLLGQFNSEKGCNPKWEWWRCVMNCFVFKFRWCPLNNKKWFESGICMKYDDDDDDSPFLGRFSFILTNIQGGLVTTRLLTFVCFFGSVSGWIMRKIVFHFLLVNILNVQI